MIDIAWSLFTGSAWVFVLLWLTPYLIASRRKHRNKNLILALSVIASLWPILWVSAAAWVILLIHASLTEPVYVYVPGPPGPQGEPGDKGRDADEIPLSKSGTYVRRPPKKP